MRIRYFAWLKHRVGHAEEELALPAGIDRLEQLKTFLAARHPGFAEALANPGVVRCAVNQKHVLGDMPLTDGDEVAFFPPVTGG